MYDNKINHPPTYLPIFLLYFFVVLIFPYFLYKFVQLFFPSPFHFHPIDFMYYFLLGIPVCALWSLLFCKGDMLCLIHFFCSCILCSTYVIWFSWHLLWYYFHFCGIYFFLSHLSFCIVQHCVFSCISSFMLSL